MIVLDAAHLQRQATQIDVAAARVEVHFGAERGRHLERDVAGAGLDVYGPERRDERAVDVRDECLADAEVQPDGLAARDTDAQIGVCFETVARASGDPHLTPFPEPATAFVPAMIVTKRAVIAHPQRRIPAASPLRHYD